MYTYFYIFYKYKKHQLLQTQFTVTVSCHLNARASLKLIFIVSFIPYYCGKEALRFLHYYLNKKSLWDLQVEACAYLKARRWEKSKMWKFCLWCWFNYLSMCPLLHLFKIRDVNFGSNNSVSFVNYYHWIGDTNSDVTRRMLTSHHDGTWILHNNNKNYTMFIFQIFFFNVS